MNGITKIQENGLKTCPDSPEETKENVKAAVKDEVDDVKTENGIDKCENLNGSVDMEECKEQILELVVKEGEFLLYTKTYKEEISALNMAEKEYDLMLVSC